MRRRPDISSTSGPASRPPIQLPAAKPATTTEMIAVQICSDMSR